MEALRKLFSSTSWSALNLLEDATARRASVFKGEAAQKLMSWVCVRGSRNSNTPSPAQVPLGIQTRSPRVAEDHTGSRAEEASARSGGREVLCRPDGDAFSAAALSVHRQTDRHAHTRMKPSDTRPSGEDDAISTQCKEPLLPAQHVSQLISSAQEPWGPGDYHSSLADKESETPTHTIFLLPSKWQSSDANPGENSNTPLFISLFQKTQKA